VAAAAAGASGDAGATAGRGAPPVLHSERFDVILARSGAYTNVAE
jgi:hypothetical protein